MKRSVILGILAVFVAMVAGYAVFVTPEKGLTMTPEAEIKIAGMGNEVTMSAATISSG